MKASHSSSVMMRCPKGAGQPPPSKLASNVANVKITKAIRLLVRKVVRYEIDMKKVIQRKLHLGVGDGIVLVDGKPIYSAKDLKVGLFSAEQLEHM